MGEKKNKTVELCILLLVVLMGALLIESSPFYYKKILDYIDAQNDPASANNTPYQTGAMDYDYNENLRKSLENGGSISFMYNYIPSDRSWDTMYTYSISQKGNTGDCSFRCTRNTIEYGGQEMCSCYYSHDIWIELLDLILDYGELKDTTSVYDANGKVVSTPIAKTISMSGGVYSPRNINEIEAFFKKLAVNAGVEKSELDWNIKVDDAKIEDKTMVRDLHGNFFWNPIGAISDQEKQQLESLLRSKYEETGVRLYIILYNTNNLDDIIPYADKMMYRATSPALAFGVSADQKGWTFRYLLEKSNNSPLKNAQDQLTNAFSVKGSIFTKLVNVINKIYELY